MYEEIIEVSEVSPFVFEEVTKVIEVNKNDSEEVFSDSEISVEVNEILDTFSNVNVEDSLTEVNSLESSGSLESFFSDIELLYKFEEIKEDAYAVISTFTYGELAIFILLFVFYLTYLMFKFWSVLR